MSVVISPSYEVFHTESFSIAWNMSSRMINIDLPAYYGKDIRVYDIIIKLDAVKEDKVTVPDGNVAIVRIASRSWPLKSSHSQTHTFSIYPIEFSATVIATPVVPDPVVIKPISLSAKYYQSYILNQPTTKGASDSDNVFIIAENVTGDQGGLEIDMEPTFPGKKNWNHFYLTRTSRKKGNRFYLTRFFKFY